MLFGIRIIMTLHCTCILGWNDKEKQTWGATLGGYEFLKIEKQRN